MPDTPTMDSVYFYKFNNYYNRIIKRYESIEDYGEPIASQLNCNFVHGDGVNASFTLNKGLLLNDTPDYCIVSDYNGNISRWYVINSFKSRSGQDLLTLRRDLIADFYDDVIKHSPCLIRKGYVSETSPFIFNDEGVKYNKIKVEEKLIKDDSNCSYIVGFIANNTGAIATINGNIKSTNYDYNFASLTDFPYKNYVEGAGNTHTSSSKRISSTIYYAMRYTVLTRTSGHSYTANCEVIVSEFGYSKPTWYSPTYATQISSYLSIAGGPRATNFQVDSPASYQSGKSIEQKAYLLAQEVGDIFNNRGSGASNGLLKDRVSSLLGEDLTTYNNLLQYVGKKIKVGGIIYSVSLQSEDVVNNRVSASSEVQHYVDIFLCPKYWELNNIASGVDLDSTYNSLATSDIDVLAKTEKYYLLFTPSVETIHTSLDDKATRTHLSEQPYDMFVLINESNINYKVGATNYVSNHEVNINIAQSICEASGTASYDIQIVPFNPIQGSILADGTINWLNYDVHEIYDSANNVVGHYVMCSSADFNIVLDKDDLKFNPTNYKLDYNTKQYRLCSPNQETIFDFSPAMNGGIDTWQVTANYRPYASYIKIQPTWNNLYGESKYNNLTDFRGLVYNSSICVTQLNDNWSNYISSNKNYQQLFDNQINTLTKSNQVQINALEETLGWRSYTGMPISSVARVIGGSKDIEMQRELNNLALSKMQTDFNYQMDNIQSMPHTIKKLTNINGDTRIFPYIELYSCSTFEEESFNDKIKYTGMTIMTTGYIWNYLQLNEETFVQASLIRLDTSRSEESADNHIAIEIANELDKGVYITKESE